MSVVFKIVTSIYCYNSISIYSKLYFKDSTKLATFTHMDMCIQNVTSQNMNKIFRKLCVLCLTYKTYNAIKEKVSFKC